MAIVQPKSIKYRLFVTHLFMLAFIALIVFPLVMVIAISFRSGNFAVGEIIPSNPTLDHWRLALGFSITNADGVVTPPPFPVLRWLWNSIKVAGISSVFIVALSTTSAMSRSAVEIKNYIETRMAKGTPFADIHLISLLHHRQSNHRPTNVGPARIP